MKIMTMIIKPTPTWMIAALLFLTGIGLGAFVPHSRGSERAVFVKDGPLYDGQKKLLGEFVEACMGRDAKGCGDLYAENALYMIPENQYWKGTLQFSTVTKSNSELHHLRK